MRVLLGLRTKVEAPPRTPYIVSLHDDLTCELDDVDLCWASMKFMSSCFVAVTVHRYNDLTRPRSLQVDSNAPHGHQEHPPVGQSGPFFASTSGNMHRLRTHVQYSRAPKAIRPSLLSPSDSESYPWVVQV